MNSLIAHRRVVTLHELEASPGLEAFLSLARPVLVDRPFGFPGADAEHTDDVLATCAARRPDVVETVGKLVRTDHSTAAKGVVWRALSDLRRDDPSLFEAAPVPEHLNELAALAREKTRWLCELPASEAIARRRGSYELRAFVGKRSIHASLGAPSWRWQTFWQWLRSRTNQYLIT